MTINSNNLENLKLYNSLIRGTKWLINNYESREFSFEDFRLRINFLIYIKLFDVLLDGYLTKINKIELDQIFKNGAVDKVLPKAEFDTEIDKLFSYLYEGLKITLVDAKTRNFKSHQIEHWWPYCKNCLPKGYNCYVSFSYDFLNALSEIRIMKQIIEKFQGKIEDKIKKEEDLNIRLEWIEFKGKIEGYNEWLTNQIEDKIISNLFDMRYKELKMEEHLFRTINSSTVESKTTKSVGFPIMFLDRKAGKIDHRADFINLIENSSHEVLDKFLFIKNLKKEFSGNVPSELKSIDPLITCATVKFLVYWSDRSVAKQIFQPDITDICSKALNSIKILYEGFHVRNDLDFNLPGKCSRNVIFDSTNIPFDDGAWMNFEIMPEPPQDPKPDYSLKSSLDIASDLIFIISANVELDEKLIKELKKIIKSAQNYVLEERLGKIKSKEDFRYRMDISNWHDHYTTSCEYSDMSGTISMLDFLLNIALGDLLLNDGENKCAELLEQNEFLMNLTWLQNQQAQSLGYWPII